MFPFMTRQVVQLAKDEFVALLNSSLSLPCNSLGRTTKQMLLKLGEREL